MISLTSPNRTFLHDWPAGQKLAMLCIVTCALFLSDRLPVHLAALLSVLVVYVSAGRTFLLSGLSKLRILWPFLLVVAGWHLVTGAHEHGTVILLRLMTAFSLANLVTMTTPLSDMMESVRFMSSPLERFGINSRAIEIAIALAVRMTPTLLAKGRDLSDSWRARSRKKTSWRVVLPFVLLALDDADRVADAIKARGGLHPRERI